MTVSRPDVFPPEVSRAARSDGLAQALALFLALLILPGMLRGWLLWSARAELGGIGSGALLHALWMGLRLDGVIAAILTLPGALLLLLPEGARRRALGAWSALCLVFMALALCAELVFFRYYGFRANYLVLEHGADPEVLHTLVVGY